MKRAIVSPLIIACACIVSFAADQPVSAVDELIKAKAELINVQMRPQDRSPRFTDIQKLVADAERKFAELERKLAPTGELAAELQSFYQIQKKYLPLHPTYKQSLNRLKELALRQEPTERTRNPVSK